MENMTKELMHLKLYNWQTLCRSTEEGIRGTFLIDEVTCQECLRINSSGSVAAPTWYTENEMYDWLIRNNYHENIARELSSKWAADLQGAFNKGFEKGTRELKEREKAIEELLPIAERKFNGISIDDAASHREYIALKAIIERARKTLNQ